MTTGLHTVRDVMCAKCGETLGWKYGQSTHLPSQFPEYSLPPFRRLGGPASKRDADGSTLRLVLVDRAYESAQKYKEGKYILERAMWSELIPP